MFPLGRSTHTSLYYIIIFGSGRFEKLFLAGRQIRAKAEARPASFRREIVSDGIKAARSRENLVDDFIPSRYLAVSCQDRRHYWNDDENIGEKKLL